MSDHRLTAFNGNVAHSSLRGQVDAKRFTDGDLRQISVQKTALFDAPDGAMDRQLIFGQDFRVLDEDEDLAFGFSVRDGYCGYVARSDLGVARPVTHFVNVRQTYGKGTPNLKKTEKIIRLSFGSRLQIVETTGAWSRVAGVGSQNDGAGMYVPTCHIAPLPSTRRDPVDVALLFLGTPYLWGGNSSDGIDCSGLVQAAFQACGHDCPGDSDLQEKSLGNDIPPEGLPKRGDLVFWKGHVALALDADQLIHANAHHMAVVVEDRDAAIRRITKQGGGAITSCKRV